MKTMPRSAVLDLLRNMPQQCAFSRRAFNALVSVAVLVLACAVSYGQQLTATLSGTAMDPTGAAIPNAQVEVRNEASGDIRRTVTNQSGYFTVTALLPGTYTTTITAP